MIDTKFNGADNKHLFAVFDGHGQVTVTVMANGASARPRSAVGLQASKTQGEQKLTWIPYNTTQYNTK